MGLRTEPTEAESQAVKKHLEAKRAERHVLTINAYAGHLGASCSCGEWHISHLKDGIDYTADWEAHRDSAHNAHGDGEGE